jgi:hypothetical protein
MNESDRKQIQKLKEADPFTGFREQDARGEYKVQVLGRGETAFYQEADRALLFELLAGRGTIFARSIRRWDDGKKVTDAERAVIVERVAAVLRKLGATKVEVIET